MLRYGEMIKQAAALGRQLQERGLKPGTLLALYLSRSPEFVLGILGSWWAGAAFLPLDPCWPRARLEEILQESQAKLLLNSPKLSDPLLGLPMLSPKPQPQPQPYPDQAPHLEPETLAYLIYTSGSSGRPKGVRLPQRGLLPMLEAQIRAFELGPESRCLWSLSPCFDASISDIGSALLSGASLHMEAPDLLQNPRQLFALMEARGISHADLPPSLLRHLDPRQAPSCLKTIIIGGEPSPPALLRPWARQLNLVNVYGPTEATVCSSLMRCAPDWSAPLLGQPLPGTCYQILDPEGQAAQEGELYIQGVGLALGYQAQPQLSQERFPLIEGGRAFRSGDRVRLCPDGEYLFLGRIDRQLKIRGRLIAPEEIEAQLSQHPQIERVALLKHRSGVLLAALSARAPIPEEDLRLLLSERLPEWMIPQRWLQLEQLPETSSGKIDVQALARAELLGPGEIAEPPQSSREAQLITLYEQILSLQGLGRRAHFFNLGGDSLSLLELTARAEGQGLALRPELLRAYPRPMDLAPQLGVEEEGISSGRLETLSIPDPGLKAPLRAPRWPPQKILLTGATGFLGGQLLKGLLERSNAEIICLIRAPSIEAARLRLPVACRVERVQLLCGDLERPSLGLSSQRWERLAKELDAIYHFAARVHLLEPLESLLESNLRGCHRILRLCAQGQPKILHYASTLSVFVSTDHPGGLCREEDDLSEERRVYGGYAQSKWAAERLIRRSTCAPRIIYRYGLLTGDTQEGQTPARDWLRLFLRGLAALGSAPKPDAAWAVDITPVDFAAKATLRLSLERPEAPLRCVHIAGARSVGLAELIQALRAAGVPLKLLEPEAWAAQLEEPRSLEEAAALLGLSRALGRQPRHRVRDLFQASHFQFEQRACADLKLHCPTPDFELLSLYARRALEEP